MSTDMLKCMHVMFAYRAYYPLEVVKGTVILAMCVIIPECFLCQDHHSLGACMLCYAVSWFLVTTFVVTYIDHQCLSGRVLTCSVTLVLDY